MFPTFGSTNIPASFNSTVNNMNLPFRQSASTAPTFGHVGAQNFGTAPNLSSPFARISNTFGQTIANDQKNSLFGNNSINLFGNANKSIFGQQNPIKSNQMETLSNQSSAFKLFDNGSSKDQLGTPIKFKPIKDTESLFKGGLSHNLTITYQSLTCMKEYENKSFEELRLEDYQVNRKGAQLAYVVNNPQTATTPFFNNPTSTNTGFSQPDTLSMFGQTPGTSFGQNNPMFNNNSMKNTQGGIFINPTSNFGTKAVSKPNCPFNTNLQSTMVQSNNLFQSNTANNPQFPVPTSNTFGQPLGFANQPTFGTNQTSTNQNTGLFGQSTNFYNQNKVPSFKFSSPLGASTTGQLPGIFSSTTTTAPSFNQPTFGQANQGKLLSIPNNNTSSLFFPRQKVNSIGGGGYPIPSFGNNETKPSNIFNNFNQISLGGLPNTSYNIQRNPFQDNQVNLNQTVGPEQILNMVTTPYGANALLNNIFTTESDLNNYKKMTNPEELKKILKNFEKSKFSTKKTAVNKLPIFDRKDSVFSGLEFYDEKLIANTRINNNPKRLLIRDNKKNALHINLLESPIICDSSEPNLECENFSVIQEDTEHSDTIEDSDIVENSNEKTDKNIIDQQEQIRTEHLENTSTSNSELNESPCHSCQCIKDTGIVLTRAEYYTVPPVEELVKYVNKDGSCFVQGFTIGRYGYGSVYFPDTFDVSNMNLDELVHFRNKEITIYPDDDARPDVGHGLNRRAQITLDRVWPRDKITKTLITDVDSLLTMDYAKKLRKLCEKQGTRFVEYRPDTGSWVFRVEHF